MNLRKFMLDPAQVYNMMLLANFSAQNSRFFCVSSDSRPLVRNCTLGCDRHTHCRSVRQMARTYSL